MKRILVHLFSLVVCFLVPISVIKAQPQPPKTNVVLILIDDLSLYGVAAYGADRVSSNQGDFKNVRISTPNIDKLAKDGMMCMNAFAYPLCENTRIALMSGKLNNSNLLRPKAQHNSDITFGDVFKKAGYATGIFGKWKQTRGTKEIAAKDYIYEFGWDEFTCFDVVGEGQRYINPELVINGKPTSYKNRTDLDPQTGRRWYGPDICNRNALNFIEKNKEKPFFLYYPMLLVHDEHKPTPDTKPNALFDNFDENKDNKDGHKGDDKKYFPDMIAYMDKLIGNVVRKIDALGLSENTLIIVMGDNGTKESFTHVFPDGKTYPGRKGGNMDNGLHVPLVLKLPKQIPSAKKYDGMVNVTDIFPTICDAANIEIPHREQLNGISFWSQAKGQTGEPRKYIYTWYNGNNNSIKNLEDLLVYAFDKNFKRYAPSKEYPNGRFFDLRIDPLETKGDTVFKRGFDLRLYSGLNINKLNKEQKAAYHRLGKIIDDNAYMPVKNLQITHAPTSCKVGEHVQLNYQVIPDNATRKNIIWESENPNVATIDKFGILTAKQKGKVKVNIYSWDDAYPGAANEPVTFLKKGITASVEIDVQ